MKDTIKLSKDAKRACEILKSVDKLMREYSKLIDKMQFYEVNLVGAMVVGIYSPALGIAINGGSGQRMVCEGLIEKLRHNEGSAEKQMSKIRELVKMLEQVEQMKPGKIRPEKIN